MRFLYFYSGLPRSTQGIHIQALVEALRCLGHEVETCFPLARALAPTRTAESARAVSMAKRLPPGVRQSMQLASTALQAGRLLAECRRFRPDCVYERYGLWAGFGGTVAHRLGRPLLLEVNSATAHFEACQVAPLLRPLARRIEKAALLRADAIITVSRAQSRRLADLGICPERIHVMHNAADPGAHDRAAHRRNAERRRLGLRDEFAVAILQTWETPATRRAYGQLRLAIEALALSKADLRLLMIGGGRLLGEVRQAIASATGGIGCTFLGAVPHEEVPLLLAAADCGLIPWHEHFTSPLKLFEYMAAGLPVIAPHVEGIAEVITHGQSGLLFAPEGPLEMAQAILTAAQDRRLSRALGQRARSRVRQHHTWRQNAAGVVRIAESLISSVSAAE